MRLKCGGCGYVWESRTKMKNVSCPNCLNKVKVKK